MDEQVSKRCKTNDEEVVERNQFSQQQQQDDRAMIDTGDDQDEHDDIPATKSTHLGGLTVGADGEERLNGGGSYSNCVGKRWRTHQMAEDYVHLVSNLMYPGIPQKQASGYYPFANHTQQQQQLQWTTSLGYLTSPLRAPSVIETWSPCEVALFEAGLMQHGKQFGKIQRMLLSGSKTTKDIIAFYYIWKKTSHYRRWKKIYVPDDELEAWSQENQKKKERR